MNKYIYYLVFFCIFIILICLSHNKEEFIIDLPNPICNQFVANPESISCIKYLDSCHNSYFENLLRFYNIQDRNAIRTYLSTNQEIHTNDVNAKKLISILGTLQIATEKSRFSKI